MNPPDTMVAPGTEVTEEEGLGDVSLIGGSQPGDQGIATQDEGNGLAGDYEAPEPSEEELAVAATVFRELRDRVNDYGPEQTVEALIQAVDVVPELCRPEEWPGETDGEYHRAPQLDEIGALLLKGCRAKLPISPKHVVFLWRNKEKWTLRGVTVRSNTKSFDQRTSFLLKGRLAVVEINFHHWKTLNPLQKIFTVYHALREIDEDGASQHPDFEGYLDELEVFGPRVFRDMALLAASIERGSERELPYQLSIFDQMEDEEEDKV